MLNLCDCCGENPGTLDIGDINVVLVCIDCYEDIASTDETLIPLSQHPDYNPGGFE